MALTIRLIVFSLLTFLLSTECSYGAERFRVVSYNVENLFDTIKAPGKNDNEFLPGSKRYWNRKKYYTKLNNLSKVISGVGEWQPPALIGMCEVENEIVLDDLTKHTPLREQGYRFVVTDCADERGIDVALLYQRDQFHLLGYESYPVRFRSPKKKTRDILHVYGNLKNKDTLDVFVCHYPSRRGGTKASEPDRMRVSEVLLQKIDSLQKIRKKASVIIMGDFNDEPLDNSIKVALRTQSVSNYVTNTKKNYQTGLYNLFEPFEKKERTGSYKYKGDWNMFDQIMVSGNLLHSPNGFFTQAKDCRIYDADFILTEDKTNGGKRPKRTFYGMKYEGGFSDHLPVYADFYLSLSD